MLTDLRQYITDDIEYSGAILFFYMICQRMRNVNHMRNVLNSINEGIDDALDVYSPSYWITRVTDNVEVEDHFGIKGNFVVDMLLDCFDAAFESSVYGCSASESWLGNRFCVFQNEGRKKPKSNLAIKLDEFLQELDSEFIHTYKINDYEEGDFYCEANEDIYFNYSEIKLLNKCANIYELETILYEMNFTKASRGKYFWAGYIYSGSYNYNEYDGFDVTKECIESLKKIPIRNDLSEYKRLFDRLEFEEGKGLISLIRSLMVESYNEKDVIF